MEFDKFLVFDYCDGAVAGIALSSSHKTSTWFEQLAISETESSEERLYMLIGFKNANIYEHARKFFSKTTDSSCEVVMAPDVEAVRSIEKLIVAEITNSTGITLITSSPNITKGIIEIERDPFKNPFTRILVQQAKTRLYEAITLRMEDN